MSEDEQIKTEYENDVLDIYSWDEDIAEDTSSEDLGLVVYSRDWTIETIINQLTVNNIDINPKFQRRHVWDDKRRSKLIESLIMNVPIPEIVLAEKKEKRNSYWVLDGKQRLATIAGFFYPEKFPFWDRAKLKGLLVKKELNGLNHLDIKERFPTEHRMLQNSSIRATVITNYKDTDILYDIFFRLNTGSLQLVGQELRQVLNRGDFADYIIKTTDEVGPLHKAMNLKGPDKRLRDSELILRTIAFYLFGKQYNGNLKKFLDGSMKELNIHWKKYQSEVEDLVLQIENAIDELSKVFDFERKGDGYKLIGRKYTDGKWEARFNKVLFEVQVLFFVKLIQENVKIDQKKSEVFVLEMKKLSENEKFRETIEFSTKDFRRYQTRYNLFANLMNKVFNKSFNKPFLE